ncbi:MAG: hypothetical protein HFJ53_04800, partial [Clostridia bacterium]|nr:hypothetical protein [Clostridia bacterium]
YYPEKVVINGKEYDVTKKENQYTVLIDGIQETGNKEIIIQKIILNNGKELEITSQNTKEVEIIKKQAVIKEFNITEEAEKLIISFKVEDEDNTITNGKVVIEDEKGTAQYEERFNQAENRIEIIKDKDKEIGKYIVKIIADCNLEGEGVTHEEHKYIEKELYREEKEAQINIKIEEAIPTKYYPEKGEEIKVGYKITANKEIDIDKLQIGEGLYTVEKTEEGRYQITIQANAQAGVQEIKLQKVILKDGTQIEANNTIKIEVKKAKPTITNVKISTNIEQRKIIAQFTILDADNAYISGYGKIKENEQKEIQVGDNTLEFEAEIGIKYNLEIYASYDQDTNSINDITGEQNKVDNEKIYQEEVELVENIELKVTGIKTKKADNTETKYFEKNEKIKIEIEIQKAQEDQNPVKVVINGEEKEIVKTEGRNEVEIEGYSNSGYQKLIVEKIILESGEEVQIKNNNVAEIEILKERPKVENYTYTREENSFKVKFNLKDEEGTISKKKIVVTDENDVVLKEQEAIIGENEISFNKTASEIYVVKVIADYDLDTNRLEVGKNEEVDQILLSETIELSERLIEFKDIQEIEVYKQNGEQIQTLSEININELQNLNNYLVKVNMKDTKGFYTTIEKYDIENDNLILTLNYEKIVQYKGEEKLDKLQVTYGRIENNVATGNSLSLLIDKINNNLSGNYEIITDLDASSYSSAETTMIAGTFTGSLNGNGHTIRNLSKPLFNNIEGATVENIIIEDPRLSGGTSRGVIANNATTSTIRNIHVKNLVMRTGANESASIIGTLRTGSILEQSSSTGFEISGGNKRTAGLVGAMGNGTIKNSYAEGTLTCTQDGIGGLTGSAENNSRIENSIAKVEFKVSSGPGYNGGIVGHSMNLVLLNSVSLSTGAKGNRVHGTGLNGNSTNNYELEESTLNTNVTANKLTTIPQNEINQQFYKEMVKLDETIWDLEGANYESLPRLKNSDPNLEANKEEKPENENLYIPEYKRIKKLPDYDPKREIAYANMYKLMPFYDAKYYVSDGNKIGLDDVLNTKIIKDILPFDANNQLVAALTNNDYTKISTIKIVFEDDQIKEYTVKYNNYYGNIVGYKLQEPNITYNYNRYVLKQDEPIINQLVQYIETLDYTNDLDPITNETDSRIYKDYYNEKTKLTIPQFVLKLLDNESNYTVTMQNTILSKKIENELITSGRLKEIIYAYNYYKKWYTIEIGNVKVDDIILFQGSLFDNNMTTMNMIDEVIKQNSNRNTNSTHNFYSSNISKYTRKSNIGSFLDYIISTIGGYTNVNDWFTQNYQGVVKEIPVENKPEVEYRAWRQLKVRDNFLLPFITLPENSAYIVSSATQFLVGSQRTYISNPEDPEQREQLIQRIENYSKLIENFYNTTAGFVEPEILNRYTDIQGDHRFTKNESGSSEYQSAGTTQEPYHKYYSEAVGYWAAANGSGAYATGTNVYWNVNSALTSFGTWSHESGHNQDGKIFLKGNGRRIGTGAEDYADGNTTQGAGDGTENFNLGYEYSMDALVTTNLKPERINSVEKIGSYYKEMFETIDFLDYIEAKAFLRLSPEEQSKVALQVFYPAEEEEGYDGNPTATTYVNTGWRYPTVEQIEKMNLTTVEDLYDNRIMIRPGTTNGQIEWGGRRTLWSRRNLCKALVSTT